MSVFKVGKQNEIYTHTGIPIVDVIGDIIVIKQPKIQNPYREVSYDDGSKTKYFNPEALMNENVERFNISTDTRHLKFSEFREYIRNHVRNLRKASRSFVISNAMVNGNDLNDID